MTLYTGSNATFSPRLTEGENQFAQHMSRWGSDGYPCRKVGNCKWVWDECYGVKGAPVVYKTKKACHAAIEAFLAVLIDKRAGRI